jgi:hypothetical protein
MQVLAQKHMLSVEEAERLYDSLAEAQGAARGPLVLDTFINKTNLLLRDVDMEVWHCFGKLWCVGERNSQVRREKDETDGKTYYGLVHQSVSGIWDSLLGVCAIAIRVQTDNVAQMATLLTPEEVVWFRKVRLFLRETPVGVREELLVHDYARVMCLYAQVPSYTRIARGSRIRTRTPCRINHGPDVWAGGMR